MKTIKAAINVVPSRKTHEIEANSDQRQKIVMVFLAAQCSKLKKKLVLMLGIVRCDELFVNHVILVAKQYLYYCRQKRFLPSIRVLDFKIKMIYQLETIIAKSNNKISAHNKKWGKHKVQ